MASFPKRRSHFGRRQNKEMPNMETEAFIKEVKVGFGVFVLGVVRAFFIRVIRGIIILKNKLVSAIKKQIPVETVA